ncbi:MAG TPA: peptidyl-prolyl cis-trans isomerase [Opitutaceae bacterium]|nr:peptidyl-prolyl cis-trans isomerase [Opitutaceae bacterium]
MITWIQKYFQHHFRTVFAVLLAITIISFVFVYSASSGIGRAERRTVDRPYFGINLSSAEDSQRMLGDASLSALLNLGYSGVDNEQLQQYALQRQAALSFAAQLHLPAPTPQELTDFLKTMRVFAGQNGEFDPQAYASFRANLKANPRMREIDVSRVVADDYRVDRVQKLFAGPGYVLPGDIARQLTRADTSWKLAVATVDYDSFKPTLAPTDAELTKYFEDNAFRYEIPPRFSGSYVEFPYVNYLVQVSVTDQEVKAFYDANPARFPAPGKTDAKAKDVKSDPAADFAAVQSQVATTLKLERARRLALKAASDLTLALFESKVTPESVVADLAARKLTLKPLTPFPRGEGPAEFGGSPEIGAQAFKLAPDHFFSDALPAPASAVVLFWKETIPSRKPLFAEVRAKVATDYNENEKRKRFVDLGRTLKATLEARLKAGDSFAKAVETAAAASSVKIEARTLEPFTLRQPPQDLDYAVYGTLEHLDKGQLADMTISATKGFLVYAVEKKTPELSEANPQYVAVKAQLARVTGSTTASAMMNELVAQEMKKSEPKVR